MACHFLAKGFKARTAPEPDVILENSHRWNFACKMVSSEESNTVGENLSKVYLVEPSNVSILTYEPIPLCVTESLPAYTIPDFTAFVGSFPAFFKITLSESDSVNSIVLFSLSVSFM